jgi:SAM-dependent methyltransferase
MRKEWFAEWFNSPYYDILYQNRNEQEAKTFMGNLLNHLTMSDVGYEMSDMSHAATRNTKSETRILDLACGKGRHSRYMASKGYDVTGLDLSPASIDYAQQFETDYLHFYQNDMRKSFRTNYFDYIFNFFTSYGYFDKEYDNVITLKHVRNGLKPDGVFVMDYLNSQWVRDNLQKEYIQTVRGIDFHIKKSISKGHVIKKIAFNTEGGRLEYQEKVRLFTLAEFEQLFKKAGLKIHTIFGDYNLNPFDEKTSKRLIIKASK